MPARCDKKDLRDPLEIVEVLVACIAVMFVLIGTQTYLNNDAMNSRLATVYSLAKFNTWRIDRPADQPPIPYERATIDKVEIDGRLLSSKPPMLPLLMTAEYLALNKLAGWDLDDKRQTNQIAWVINFTLVGLAYLAAVIFFLKTLRLFIADPLSRSIMVFALAFATQLWGYATHLNNHVPAAGMLTVALYFALGVGSGKLAPAPWRFAIFGLAGGLVPTLDMPAAIFILPAGLYLLWKYPAPTIAAAVPAGLLPIAVHLAALHAATGSFLPVQMRDDVYLYEGSYWRSPIGIDALNEPKGSYLFHMTLGRVGLFSLYPILLAGAAAALHALVHKKTAFRAYILTGAAAFLTLSAYYLVKTNNYGGEAYGFRWYIVAMPVLLLMGAPLVTRLRKRWHWLFLGIMLGISFYSAFECAKLPWGSNHEWTVRLFLGPSYGPIK